MYKTILDKNAIKFLNTLPKDKSQRIVEKLTIAQNNPSQFFERLSGRQDYKLRVGKYRVIADINKKEELIEITKIDLRKKVYKK